MKHNQPPETRRASGFSLRHGVQSSVPNSGGLAGRRADVMSQRILLRHVMLQVQFLLPRSPTTSQRLRQVSDRGHFFPVADQAGAPCPPAQSLAELPPAAHVEALDSLLAVRRRHISAPSDRERWPWLVCFQSPIASIRPWSRMSAACRQHLSCVSRHVMSLSLDSGIRSRNVMIQKAIHSRSSRTTSPRLT